MYCVIFGDFIRQKGDSRSYRNIKQRLMQEGKQYSANIIRLALKELDPEGVEMRRNHRLKRRKYVNSGPNEVWHIDGNDKIKPFGFSIHGAIDGFSRKVIWLQVSDTNKHPGVISYYYTSAVRRFNRHFPNLFKISC